MFRVRSTDIGGLFVEDTFALDAINVNHVPNNITLSNYTTPENNLTTATIGTLATTDFDWTDTFTYVLETGVGSADNSKVQIIGNLLQTNAQYDFEVQDTLHIRVKTTDNWGGVFSRALDILIVDVNDTPTVITYIKPIVSDKQSAQSFMGKFKTTDQDVNDTHTYSLVAGVKSVDNSKFYISHDTLFNVNQIIYNTQNHFEFRIRTTDIGGLFIEDTFSIDVINVNDAPSDIILSNDTVQENQPKGTLIASLTTVDEDVLDTHTYVLEAGAGGIDNAKVKIVNNTLVTDTTYDFETEDTLRIRIKTIDSYTATFSKAFIITIKDVNDTATAINTNLKF